MPSTRPPVDYIERTRAQYDALGYPPYHWVENVAPPPWAELTKPLSQCRVGLIGSGGIYKTGQVAFHYKDDTSVRIIDTREPTVDAARHALRVRPHRCAHRPERGVSDRHARTNSRAKALIGSLAERAYAFMGGIYSSRRVRERLAPELANRVVRDGVDVVLLVPV